MRDEKGHHGRDENPMFLHRVGQYSRGQTL